MFSLIKDKIRHVRQEPLYMNSLFMMASTAIIAASGFIFWLLCAHLYTETQVGLATAIISVVTFIMNFSILGLNYSIIRFLPQAKDKNQLVSASTLAISAASALCAGLFLFFLPFISPKLAFIREDTWIMSAFVLFTICVTLDFATESVFLSLRSGKYIFLKNVLVSVLKLFLPLLFVSFGAVGIFFAWSLALSSALLVSIWVLVKKFRLRFTASWKTINLPHLISFSFANYLVGLLGIAPALILPLLITNTISPEMTAHFYIAFMIANLLYTIPYATTQSLFAEGSHDETNFLLSVRKAMKLIGVLLLPAILVFVLFGNLILLVFGKSYSEQGVHFLQLLTLAGLPVAINYIGLTYVNVRRKLKALLVINILGTSCIIFFSYLWIGYALTGIGMAWIVGHLIKNVLYSGYIAWLFRQEKRLTRTKKGKK